MTLLTIGICVADYEKHSPVTWTSVVQMHSRPWFLRSGPRVQWGCRWHLSRQLANGALLDAGFDDFIHARPPHVSSSQSLHPHITWVCLVQQVENSFPPLRWHHNTASPQYTTTLSAQLVSLLAVRLQLGVFLGST